MCLRNIRPLLAAVLCLAMPCSLAVNVQAQEASQEGAKIRGSEIVADKNIAGVWQLTKMVNQGEATPKNELTGSQVVVRENEISVRDGEQKERYRAVYDFDLSKSPATITMQSTMVPAGGKEGAVALGIYKVENDTWTLCYALPGKPRPTEFQSAKEDHTLLMVMKRPESMREQNSGK